MVQSRVMNQLPTTRPTLRGRFGMAASTHWIASSCAQAVLERGGNAFDAAVAGGFVLHVVEPHLNGPGGDLVGLVCEADGEPSVLMGQGPAPAAAGIEAYRGLGLELVPGTGALAAAVPGAVDAWLLLLRDFGTWEIGDVLGYAIDYAEAGHPVSPQLSTTITAVAELFRTHWPTSAEQWLIDGAPPGPGEAIRRPTYARTLRRLVESARGDSRETRIDAVRTQWAEGFVGRAIIAAQRKPHLHSDGGFHHGVMELDDIASFRAGFEPPQSVEFRGTRVFKADAWGQGPALLETLAILEGFGDDEIDPSTPAGAHRIVEAMKLGMADREAYFGDHDDLPGLVAELVNPDYIAERRRLIGSAATLEPRAGDLPGRSPYRGLPSTGVGGGQGAGAGEPTVAPNGRVAGDTCHIDVVDRWGNMASVTPSGGWLQSSPHIEELGFCLGTRLQMTWLDPSAPSALKPGRRPRTTLTPTLVHRDRRNAVALGSPGGDQQDQWQLLYLIRTLALGQEPQVAIDAPAFHTTAIPSSFWPRHHEPGGLVVEDRVGEAFLDEMRQRGHVVTVAPGWSLGRLSAVHREPSGLLSAAANPRGEQGYAVGR